MSHSLLYQLNVSHSINGNKIGDIYSHSFGQSQGNDPLPEAIIESID